MRSASSRSPLCDEHERGHVISPTRSLCTVKPLMATHAALPLSCLSHTASSLRAIEVCKRDEVATDVEECPALAPPVPLLFFFGLLGFFPVERTSQNSMRACVGAAWPRTCCTLIRGVIMLRAFKHLLSWYGKVKAMAMAMAMVVHGGSILSRFL